MVPVWRRHCNAQGQSHLHEYDDSETLQCPMPWRISTTSTCGQLVHFLESLVLIFVSFVSALSSTMPYRTPLAPSGLSFL